MNWFKKLLHWIRCLIFVIKMDVVVQNVHWPAYIDLYAVWFGRWRTSGDIRPQGFPKTLDAEGDTTGLKLAMQAGALQQLYSIDEVHVTLYLPTREEEKEEAVTL